MLSDLLCLCFCCHMAESQFDVNSMTAWTVLNFFKVKQMNIYPDWIITWRRKTACSIFQPCRLKAKQLSKHLVSFCCTIITMMACGLMDFMGLCKQLASVMTSAQSCVTDHMQHSGSILGSPSAKSTPTMCSGLPSPWKPKAHNRPAALTQHHWQPSILYRDWKMLQVKL